MSLEDCFDKLKKIRVKPVEDGRFVRLEPNGFPFGALLFTLGVIDKKRREVFVPTRGLFKRCHDYKAFKEEAMESYDKMIGILEAEQAFTFYYYTDVKDL